MRNVADAATLRLGTLKNLVIAAKILITG